MAGTFFCALIRLFSRFYYPDDNLTACAAARAFFAFWRVLKCCRHRVTCRIFNHPRRDLFRECAFAFLNAAARRDRVFVLYCIACRDPVKDRVLARFMHLNSSVKILYFTIDILNTIVYI